MIDELTLVGPGHQVKELRQYEKSLPLAKREVRYLPMPHIIIAPYCTLNMCSSSIAQRRTLHGPSVQAPWAVQAVDLPYFCDGPYRYRPAWRTVKQPGKTHGNEPGQPEATSPAGP